MSKNKTAYDVCIDLPTTVKDVGAHLEKILDCEVISSDMLSSFKPRPRILGGVEVKPGLFNGGHFTRYEAQVKLPGKIKEDEVREYFEEHLFCRVVSYSHA